jgi:hypothetical protein
MKYIAAILGLLFWLVTTFFLCITIVGWVVVLDDDYLKIPDKLLKVFNT